jgi:hypothetical protein
MANNNFNETDKWKMINEVKEIFTKYWYKSNYKPKESNAYSFYDCIEFTEPQD